MKADIKVPGMGESISEATIGNIIKPSGSAVKVDEEILELETDKVNQVLYAPQDGSLTLTVNSGDHVKIGQVIGYVDSEGVKSTSAEAKPAPEASKPSTEEPGPKAGAPVLPPAGSKGGAKKFPEAEKSKQPLAGQARLTRDAFLEEIMSKTSTVEFQPKAEMQTKEIAPGAEAAQPLQETRRKMPKIRRVIADRLVEVLRTTAMLTTFNEVDMTQVMSLREKHREEFLKKHGVKLGLMSFFVKAAASALSEFPDFNSYLEGDEIVHREYCHIGVAVGTERGVFVPVLRNCETLTYPQIEKGIENFAARARAGTIGVDDLQGGGFTITNGGVYGSLLSTPILNPPQSAILGMHKIQKRPIALDDQVVIRPMMYLALSYDHRIVDGKEAVSFLVYIKNHLEDPALELLDL